MNKQQTDIVKLDITSDADQSKRCDKKTCLYEGFTIFCENVYRIYEFEGQDYKEKIRKTELQSEWISALERLTPHRKNIDQWAPSQVIELNALTFFYTSLESSFLPLLKQLSTKSIRPIASSLIHSHTRAGVSAP